MSTEAFDEKQRLNLPFVGIPTFCRAPICENLDELDADIAFLGAPYDESSPIIPGMRFAPRRIREVSLKYAPRGIPKRGMYRIEDDRVLLEKEILQNRIVDCGDVDVRYTRRDDTFRNIRDAVSKIISRNAFPIVVGGDDSVAIPVVQAFCESAAFGKQPLDVIAIDAHLDFTDSMLGVTHAGMNPFRRISEFHNVEKMFHIGVRGIRASKSAHQEALQRGNTILTAAQLKREGIANTLLRALPSDKRNSYVNLDIDALDPTIAPGCSGTEPGGLLYGEMKELFHTIAERTIVVGLGINEINPLIDVNDITSQIAVQLTLEFLGELSETPEWRAIRSRG